MTYVPVLIETSDWKRDFNTGSYYGPYGFVVTREMLLDWRDAQATGGGENATQPKETSEQ